MDANMCLGHVMCDGCKWMQVFSSGFLSMHRHTHRALNRLNHSQTAYGCMCIFFSFMDGNECISIWMLHLDE